MSNELETLKAQLAAANAKIATMQARSIQKLTPKVSAKGAVSIYGMGKWPVTLYRGQWERLSAFIKDGHLNAFIVENAAALSEKGDAE